MHHWRDIFNQIAVASIHFFFSRVLRDSTPRFVGPSIGPSVRPSHFTFFLRSLASLLLPKWSSDLKYGLFFYLWQLRNNSLSTCQMSALSRPKHLRSSRWTIRTTGSNQSHPQNSAKWSINLARTSNPLTKSTSRGRRKSLKFVVKIWKPSVNKRKKARKQG